MASALSLIWMTAMALVLFAVVTLTALILARVRRERFERTQPDRRAIISRALLRYAVAQGPAPDLSVSNNLERQTLLETALDTAQIMRGPAKARLVQYLCDLGLDRRLRRQASRGSVRDRLIALEALCFFPGAETLAVLHRAEASRDLRIWLAALRTRAALGVGPDMLGLLELVERPGARRSPIMYDLIAARARDNLPEALRALQGVLAPLTRALLVRALGETGQMQAIDPLRIALHNPDAAVRAAAAGALGVLGFDSAGDALARATRDADWRVRLKASEAIGQLNLWRHAECLAALRDDPVWWVRFRAEEALKRLGAFGARRLLEVASPDTPPQAPRRLRGARR